MLSDPLGRAAQIGRLVGAPQIVTTSTTTARSTILKPNTAYRFYSDQDGWIQFGGSGVNATSSSNPVKAGFAESFRTDDTNIYVAEILPTGTGKLYISELEL